MYECRPQTVRIIRSQSRFPFVIKSQQQLSYRKQIARQLRTQYVEGIYRPKYYTVTLKSGLEVIHSNWCHS